MVNGKYSYQINVSTWNISKNENKNILNKFTSVENLKKKIHSTIFIKHEVWQILMQT